MKTADLSTAVRDSGYALWPGFLGTEEIAYLQTSSRDLLRGRYARRNPKSTRAWDLHLHGTPYVEALTDVRLAEPLDDLLGKEHLLSDASLNQVQPGQPVDDWHIDYPYNEMPTVVAASILGLQCVLALDPFHSGNGATQILPGTHLRPRCPAEPYGPPVTFHAEPGTLLVMAAATWHRSGLNRSTAPRTAMLMSFVERWIRPMSAPVDGLPRPLPPRLASLLGESAGPETINGVPV